MSTYWLVVSLSLLHSMAPAFLLSTPHHPPRSRLPLDLRPPGHPVYVRNLPSHEHVACGGRAPPNGGHALCEGGSVDVPVGGRRREAAVLVRPQGAPAAGCWALGTQRQSTGANRYYGGALQPAGVKMAGLIGRRTWLVWQKLLAVRGISGLLGTWFVESFKLW